MNTLETYCPYCDCDVCAPIEKRQETLAVRGIPTEYTALVAVCPKCCQAIGDMALESDNLEAAYTAYRLEHDVMSPSDIKELRHAYDLSLREFSRFLGFGEQTIAKYEQGTLPDTSHNNTLVLAKSPEGAAFLLDRNRASISEQSAARVEEFIANESQSISIISFMGAIEAKRNAPPSELNGYRTFDEERFSALVCALADRCRMLYKTKLQKAMFFCDSLAYERLGRSLTGASYAHANYGPVVDKYDVLIAWLEEVGSIEKDEQEFGEIVIPLTCNDSIFTDVEIALIDETAEFVNTFTTAGQISEFSHSLKSWMDTDSGQLIRYGAEFGEIGRAMASLR